jgi:hypothetical protein
MKIQKTIFILLLITSAFMACTKDDDNTVSPGTSTPTDPRNKFIGNWVCNETSEVFPSTTFPVEIFAHTTIANRIVISNFYNLGPQQTPCQMEINGDSITIFQQTVSGHVFIGAGKLLTNSTIRLTYTADDGSGTIDNVVDNLTKTN